MRQEGLEREGQNSGEQRHEEICGRERDGSGNMVVVFVVPNCWNCHNSITCVFVLVPQMSSDNI